MLVTFCFLCGLITHRCSNLRKENLVRWHCDCIPHHCDPGSGVDGSHTGSHHRHYCMLASYASTTNTLCCHVFWLFPSRAFGYPVFQITGRNSSQVQYLPLCTNAELDESWGHGYRANQAQGAWLAIPLY